MEGLNWILSIEREHIQRLRIDIDEQNAVLLRGRTSFLCTGPDCELSIERDRRQFKSFTD